MDRDQVNVCAESIIGEATSYIQALKQKVVGYTEETKRKLLYLPILSEVEVM